MKKILCNISKYVDGKEENGHSLAYFGFYETFELLGHKVRLFENNSKKIGQEKMNKNFIKTIEDFEPDIIFSMNISSDFDKQILLSIKNNSNIQSLCWMSDDQWRFEELGSKCIGHFDYIITTDPVSHEEYKKLSQKSILSEYGIKKQNLIPPAQKYKYDVTFIGGKNSWRKFVIDELESKGIHVECFGAGWENGRVSFEQMYDIFNTSKVNLNLSNSIHYNLRYLLSGIIHFKKQEKAIDILRPLANMLLSRKNAEQIKARFFEVMGAGGFLLSYDLEGIEKYFVPQKDIGIYAGGSINNIIEKIQFYLNDEIKRQNIANNGFKKIQNRYTFEKILSDIIKQIS